jgi:hypothetical protein
LCRSAATKGSSQASRSSRQSPTIASLHKLAPYESPIGQKGNPLNYKSAKVVLGQDLLNPPSRRQNGKDIEGKWSPQAVILPARAFYFEIEAILASFGFDPFCPLLRWQAWT